MHSFSYFHSLIVIFIVIFIPIKQLFIHGGGGDDDHVHPHNLLHNHHILRSHLHHIHLHHILHSHHIHLHRILHDHILQQIQLFLSLGILQYYFLYFQHFQILQYKCYYYFDSIRFIKFNKTFRSCNGVAYTSTLHQINIGN